MAANFVREVVNDQIYEYLSLGEHIVIAPGICGGRPTFKYTRLEVSVVLDLLASGWTKDDIIREYAHSNLTPEAVEEAIHLAKDALVRLACETNPAL